MGMFDNLNPHTVAPRQAILDRLKVGTRRHIPASIARTLSVRQYQDHALRELDGMIVELSAEVLAEKLPPETVTTTRQISQRFTVEWAMPATWRDLWKLTYANRWWARWWVRRHPARTVLKPQTLHMHRNVTMSVDLHRYRTYPEATVSLPVADYGRPVLAHVVGEPVWTVR